MVDEFSREYRVLPSAAPRAADPLPHDMERMSEQAYLYMNVRVPKRKRADKVELLKDAYKRAAVVFPAVGEILNVRYSPGLQSVWGSKAVADSRVRVKVTKLVPRSAQASTAALFAIRV